MFRQICEKNSLKDQQLNKPINDKCFKVLIAKQPTLRLSSKLLNNQQFNNI